MTVQDMIIELYGLLGEKSYLCPYSDPNDEDTFDITTDGSVRLLKWLNRGYRRILSWKFPSGTLMRYSAREEVAFVQADVVSGTCQGGAVGYAELASTDTADDDDYNGRVIYFTGGTNSGSSRMVVDFVNSTKRASLNRDLDSAPDTTSTYSIYPKYIDYGDIESSEDDVVAVMKVTDMEDSRDLATTYRTEAFSSYLEDYGTPTSWYIYGKKIYFDLACDDERWFRIEYLKCPSELSTASEEPDIPRQFHEAILFWAHWFGLKRDGEMDAAYAVRRDITDLMSTLSQEYEWIYEREGGGLEPEDTYYGYN